MDEKTIQVSFGIIAHAGDAKSLANQAIQIAKKNENFDEARNLIKEAEETVVKAHRVQTELMQSEAKGNKTEMSVLLIHAQDHLMTTMNFIQLAKEFIDMYELISTKLLQINKK